MLKALAEASIARVLLDAAASEERDPERLKNAALSESAFVKRSRWPSSPELATRYCKLLQERLRRQTPLGLVVA